MGNKDALLEAALVCLRERGFGGTRARDLASTAGVSLGAITYHFGSTEGLLNEAVAESSRRWLSGFQASMAAATNAAAGLEGVATDGYREFEANRALLIGIVEALAHAQRSSAAREQLAALYDELRQGVSAAVGGGGRDGESVASVMIALVDGLMIQWLLAPDRCPAPDMLRRAALALAGLTAP
jgi:AcrR family transcriptional regulator